MTTSYAESLSWLYAFADLERGVGLHQDAPPEMGLARVHRLLAKLGNPHHGRRFVHVAGSKGKGSVCAFVAAAAEAAGYRTGLFTQPHLHSFRERLQIDGIPIEPRVFARQIRHIEPLVNAVHAEEPREGKLTTFEIATTLALHWFAEEKVDIAVVEVGLGGRLDATNVIAPIATAITTIVLEHTRLLGTSLEAIAGEKAGIVKPDVPLIVARQAQPVLDVVSEAAQAVGAPLSVAEPLEYRDQTVWRDGRPLMLASETDSEDALPLGLIGFHQLANAAVALGLCAALGAQRIAIPRDARRAGLAAPLWPGRLEVIPGQPMTVVDSAHTPEAVALTVRSVRELLGRSRGPVILGALRDKRIPDMVAELQSYATRLILLRPQHPRGWTPELLQHRFASVGDLTRAAIAPDSATALRVARAACGPREAVLALGSVAIAAQVRAAAGVPCKSDPDVGQSG